MYIVLYYVVMRDSQIIEEKLLRNTILDYNLQKTSLDCPSLALLGYPTGIAWVWTY